MIDDNIEPCPHCYNLVYKIDTTCQHCGQEIIRQHGMCVNKDDMAMAMTLINEGVNIYQTAEKFDVPHSVLIRDMDKARRLGFAAWDCD